MHLPLLDRPARLVALPQNLQSLVSVDRLVAHALPVRALEREHALRVPYRRGGADDRPQPGSAKPEAVRSVARREPRSNDEARGDDGARDAPPECGVTQ